MSTKTVWNGTREEGLALADAVAHNCVCEFGLMGVRLRTCEPHRMMTEDQRALDGLLFVRQVVERLYREEFLVS